LGGGSYSGDTGDDDVVASIQMDGMMFLGIISFRFMRLTLLYGPLSVNQRMQKWYNYTVFFRMENSNGGGLSDAKMAKGKVNELQGEIALATYLRK
jgi:hypothetical protein